MSHAPRSRIPFAVVGNNPIVSLEVYPPAQIVFTNVPGDDHSFGEFHLINSSSSARFAFKMKSTAQKGVIRVTPVTGVVEPRQTVKAEVMMLHSTIGYTVGAASTNTWMGHRILVQSLEVPKYCADLDSIWATTPWRMLKATRLNCVFPLSQRRATLPALSGGNSVARRVAQLNVRSTTAAGGILTTNGATSASRVAVRRRKKVTVAVTEENNAWAATANTAYQNDWAGTGDKENAAPVAVPSAAGNENAWGAQNAWGGDGANGGQDNVAGDAWGAANNVVADNAWGAENNVVADNAWGAENNVVADNAWGAENNVAAESDWGAENNAAAGDAWGAGTDGNNVAADDAWATENNVVADDAWAGDQNNGGTAAVDDWGNAQNNDNNANWAANADGAAQENDNAWGADNNNAVVPADAAWATDDNNAPTVGTNAAWATDNATADAVGAATAWPGENNALVVANTWRNAVDHGAEKAFDMTFSQGRVVVAFKGIQDLVFGILVVLVIGLIMGKIF